MSCPEGFDLDSYELELEIAEVLNRHAAKKSDKAVPEPCYSLSTRRNTIAVTSRKHSIDDFITYEKQREKPAQLKLEREIEVAAARANELRTLQSVRQLTVMEIEELKRVELDEFEARRKLKRTKDAALRAKRYRIRRAAKDDFNSMPVESYYDNPGESQSPDELRPVSSTSFTDPMTSAAAFISKLTNPTSPSRKRPHSPSPNVHSNNFQCSQCDAQFTVFGSFVSHMRTQHLKSTPEETTSCKFCKATFPNQQQKLTHVIEHFISTQTNFSCQQCGKVFENGSQYRQHHTNYHTDVLQRCSICLQIFSQTAAYQEHIMNHVLAETKYSCVACSNLVFESIELLEAHIQLVHDRTQEGSISNGIYKQKIKSNPSHLFPNSNGSSTSSSGKALKCSVCDQECPNENALDEHRLLNHCKVQKSDQCAVCKEILHTVNDFNLHMNKHSDGFGDMNCIICRQGIRNEFQLKMHAEYHLDSDESNSKCPTCGEIVPQGQMTRHFLNHASESFSPEPKREEEESELSEGQSSSTFTCHCGQQFEDQNELTTHALQHLNEALPGYTEQNSASFDCPKCPKRFSSLSALQGHSHVHMNTKLFKCDKCGQTFATGARLHQHKLKHQNKTDLKCRICDKRFPGSEQLQSHMKVHESSLTNFGSAKTEVLEV